MPSLKPFFANRKATFYVTPNTKAYEITLRMSCVGLKTGLRMIWRSSTRSWYTLGPYPTCPLQSRESWPTSSYSSRTRERIPSVSEALTARRSFVPIIDWRGKNGNFYSAWNKHGIQNTLGKLHRSLSPCHSRFHSLIRLGMGIMTNEVECPLIIITWSEAEMLLFNESGTRRARPSVKTTNDGSLDQKRSSSLFPFFFRWLS